MTDTDTLIKKPLLERIHAKKRLLDSKRPLSEDVLKKLREDLRLRHTYHSNAIEGNTLTLSETKLVIEEGITVGGKPLKDCLEASNTARAFELIEKLAKGKKKITHEIIQQIHEAVTKGILEEAGKYRTKNVRITGAPKSPPDFSKIPKLMDELIKSIEKDKLNPIDKSAYLHHKFVEIHPFVNGNGRAARLLTNLYLIQKGFPPIVLKVEDREKYYKALRSADKGELTSFVNFIAKAVNEALAQFLSVFGGEDELLPLKELANISPYSQEYLSLRARQGALDAVKIDGIWYSSKKALKEYQK